MPAHERVAEFTAEHAAPGDHSLGPAPPHIRLERQVEGPNEAGHKRSPTDPGKEKSELDHRRNMMRRAQPFEHLNAEYERCQPARSPQGSRRASSVQAGTMARSLGRTPVSRATRPPPRAKEARATARTCRSMPRGHRIQPKRATAAPRTRSGPYPARRLRTAPANRARGTIPAPLPIAAGRLRAEPGGPVDRDSGRSFRSPPEADQMA